MTEPMNNKEDSGASLSFANSTGLCTTPQPYNGWVSPTASDWPVFELKDTCSSTPLSSPITPFHNKSGNCFEDSFQTALSMEDRFNQAYDDCAIGTMAYQLDTSRALDVQKDSQHNTPSYGPQLVFEDNRTFGGFAQSPGIDPIVLPPFALQPEIPTGYSYEDNTRGSEAKRQIWGNSTKRSSTRKKNHSTGRGEINKEEQRRGSNAQSSSTRPSHQLRSTKNTQKASSVKSKPTDPRELSSHPSTTGKASHNLVEKQYRNRLNGQFNTLLSSIPSEVIKTEITGYVREDGPERRVSKAEVLVLAKKHIETLERERQCLEEERQGLKGTAKTLKDAWVTSGGGILP